jgi:hypothetical protein
MPRTINQIRRGDPSKTTVLRKKFAAELRARMDLIRRLVIDAVVTQDAFGLTGQVIIANRKKKEIGAHGTKRATPGQFAFGTSAEKLDAFMDWLNAQVAAGVLGVVDSRSRTVPTRWTDAYIDSAYKKAIVQARVEMAKAGVEGAGASYTAGLSGTIALMQPIHKERVSLIYTRTFSDLKGITAEMDKQISRELAQGLAEGRGPREIARSLADRVDKIGKTRAELLARTEVIRAHAEGTLTEFEAFRVEGVMMGVEFHTASDPCPQCAEIRDGYGGEPIAIAEARGVIPVHPRCRCVWLPAAVGEKKKERNINRGKVRRAA